MLEGLDQAEQQEEACTCVTHICLRACLQAAGGVRSGRL